MKFGIKTPPQHCTWQEMLDVWQLTDAMQIYDSCWNFDHFYPLIGDADGPCMEAWVTLTALAANTSRVRIGCMVNGTPYRHPALTANMAASLDIVSNGRLNLGIGAGWHEQECTAYGIDLLPMKQRMDRFDEAVAVIRQLLRQESTSFNGEYYSLTHARCEPKGPQKEGPPIVIGGGGEKRTLSTVAKYADHWNLPFASPDQFKRKQEILLQHCEAVGRDSGEIECSVQIALSADASMTETLALTRGLQEVGVDTVIYSLRPPYLTATVETLGRALESF